MMPGTRRSDGWLRSWSVGFGAAIALTAAACTPAADAGLSSTTIPESVTTTTVASPAVPLDATTTTVVDESLTIWDSDEFQKLGGFWLVPYSTLIVRVSDPNPIDSSNDNTDGEMWTFTVSDVVLGTHEDATIAVAGVFETGPDFDEAILFLAPHPTSQDMSSPELWVVRYDDAGIVIADLDVWQEALEMADGALGLMVDPADGTIESRQMTAAAALQSAYGLFGRMPLSTEPELFDTAPGEPHSHSHSDEEGTVTSNDQADTPLVVELEDKTIVFSNWFFMLLDGTATVTVLGPNGELLLEGPVEGPNAVMREVGASPGDFEFFDDDGIVATMTQEQLMAATESVVGVGGDSS